jgi:intracellular septation protein A
MNTEKEIKKFEKARTQSRKAIPVTAVSFVVLAFVFWIIVRFVSVPVWVIVIVLGVTALTLLGDIINYIYCGRKLKALFSKQQRPLIIYEDRQNKPQ